MTIKQFNGTYLANEDRILFRFNTPNQEEFRFWLTRRITVFILGATDHLLTKKRGEIHSPITESVQEFEKPTPSGPLKSTNIPSQGYEAGIHFPFGYDPLLVMEVGCSLMAGGETLAQGKNVNTDQEDDVLSLDFSLPGGANLNFKLDVNTFQAMCILLDQLREQAQWGKAYLQAKELPAEDHFIQIRSSKNTSIH